MRIWSSEHTFNHPWDTVVTAVWRKYPNPHNPAVKGVDVVDRSLDDQGRLRSHRLMITNWGMPKWVSMIIGNWETVYASEHSIVDAEQKSFTLNSRNITLGSVLKMEEKITYSQDPTDAEKTKFKKDLTVTVSGLPLCGALENYMIDRNAVSSGKGFDAMEWCIDKVKTEAKEFSDSVEKEAKKLSMEAQKCMDKCMDNMKKEAKEISNNVEKEAKKISSSFDQAQNIFNPKSI